MPEYRNGLSSGSKFSAGKVVFMVLALTIADWSCRHSHFCLFRIYASLGETSWTNTGWFISPSHLKQQLDLIWRGELGAAQVMVSKVPVNDRITLVQLLSKEQAAQQGVCWKIHRFGWIYCFPVT